MVNPEDLTCDCVTLRATGLFGIVTVDIGGGGSGGSGGTSGSDGVSGRDRERVLYCAGDGGGGGSGGGGVGEGGGRLRLREVIEGAAVTFRVTPVPAARVTADVRFAWGCAALAAAGDDAEAVEAEVVRQGRACRSLVSSAASCSGC
jgi:hypothetical protein